MAKEKYEWVMCRVPKEAKDSLDKTHKLLKGSSDHLSPQKAELWISGMAWLEENAACQDVFINKDLKSEETFTS